MIFTAIAVINVLRHPPRSFGLIPVVAPLYSVPDLRYQVHCVLQFVPTHVDVRVCNFSERVERGLMMAYTETRKRSHEAGNVTVQVHVHHCVGTWDMSNVKMSSLMHLVPAFKHHHGRVPVGD